MFEFPCKLDKALQAAAKDRGFRLMRETHYDAINRELCWFERNMQKRIDFDFDGNIVRVTFYGDRFPCFPRLWIGLHNIVPMFPYVAKIEWRCLDELPPGGERAFYDAKLQSYIAHCSTKKGAA